MNNGVVFATVGTTKFDKFVSTLLEENTLNALRKKGFCKIIAQIGNGTEILNEENCKKAGISLSYYRFKNSIHEDILKADLVISHAGAGTCLEVLAEEKPLVVVVNEDLMHNHQVELADQMSTEGYLFSCTCDSLVETVKNMDLSQLKKMPLAQPNLFADYLDQFMGFQPKARNKML